MTIRMIFPATAVALALGAAPALAQTDTANPAPASPSDDAMMPSQPGAMHSDAMREMMRGMMMEMMPDGPMSRECGGGWKKGRRHHDADRRGGRMGPGDGMRSAMMHGAGMRIMFAVMDADGDGALSLAEIQDFHGRIFKAVDKNGDGKVEMAEIESFFHGDKGASDDADDE
ncbi:EF-hand domain-containing protein [Mesorhizobium marinum]|uniref:EF-hand domain-containing protein n=1 Tax=Mesorhizobium marinum TaxID=3228790 RepID=UPI0034658D1D